MYEYSTEIGTTSSAGDSGLYGIFRLYSTTGGDPQAQLD